MDISYKFIIYILLGTCNLSFLVAQNSDSLSYLSKDFYKSFHFDYLKISEEIKTTSLNSLYYSNPENKIDNYMDTIFIFKNDMYEYVKIDTIKPKKIYKDDLKKIHFWDKDDRTKLAYELNVYYTLDSIAKGTNKKPTIKEIDKINEFYHYHDNFYIVEKLEDYYLIYKVFRRERVFGFTK